MPSLGFRLGSRRRLVDVHMTRRSWRQGDGISGRLSVELLAGDEHFPVGVFGVDEAVVLHEALLAGGWVDVTHVAHEHLLIETVTEGGGSDDAHEFPVAINRLSFRRPRIAVFVVVLKISYN